MKQEKCKTGNLINIQHTWLACTYLLQITQVRWEKEPFIMWFNWRSSLHFSASHLAQCEVLVMQRKSPIKSYVLPLLSRHSQRCSSPTTELLPSFLISHLLFYFFASYIDFPPPPGDWRCENVTLPVRQNPINAHPVSFHCGHTNLPCLRSAFLSVLNLVSFSLYFFFIKLKFKS